MKESKYWIPIKNEKSEYSNWETLYESQMDISEKFDNILAQAEQYIKGLKDISNPLKHISLNRKEYISLNRKRYLNTTLPNNNIPILAQELCISEWNIHQISTRRWLFYFLAYLYKDGFFEDNIKLQEEVYQILQKFHQLIGFKQQKHIAEIQAEFKDKINNAQYSEYEEYIWYKINTFLYSLSDWNYKDTDITVFEKIINYLREENRIDETFYQYLLDNKTDISSPFRLSAFLIDDYYFDEDKKSKEELQKLCNIFFSESYNKNNDIENNIEQRYENLMSHIEEILNILESGSVSWEEDYISQFYWFLLDNKIITHKIFEDAFDWDNSFEHLCNILDSIFLWEFFWETKKYLNLFDKYLYILNSENKKERYEKIMNTFPGIDDNL